MIVDAHQHYWTLARGDYRWLSRELAPLYRDFGPADLEPELARAGVDGTILVQAADSAAETRHLLALAARTPHVLGVVGWIELDAASAPRELAELAREPLLVGVRPMLQDIEDERWVLRPRVLDALCALAPLELCFDALVVPRQLPVIAELLERVPELDLVVDHGAKPRIGTRAAPWAGFASWRADHARIAAHPRARCKLSGLVTEIAGALPLDDARGELARTVDALLELYGPARCLWGSDWPVLGLRCDYRAWWELSRELLARLSPRERADVLGANALTFYRRARRAPRIVPPAESLA
ncbi:MAG: amidohydrolase [Planctomycetota bacterium]|nr:MAG: amidohydrolase [Planctomycetota bacterium]